MVPAALANRRVDGLLKCVCADYADPGCTPVEIPNQSSKKWQADGERSGAVDWIDQPEMLCVALPLPAEFLAEDGMIREPFGDASSEQLLCPSIRICNLGSVRLPVNGHMLPKRKNELTGLARQSQGKLQDFGQG